MHLVSLTSLKMCFINWQSAVARCLFYVSNIAKVPKKATEQFTLANFM